MLILVGRCRHLLHCLLVHFKLRAVLIFFRKLKINRCDTVIKSNSDPSYIFFLPDLFPMYPVQSHFFRQGCAMVGEFYSSKRTRIPLLISSVILQFFILYQNCHLWVPSYCFVSLHWKLENTNFSQPNELSFTLVCHCS